MLSASVYNRSCLFSAVHYLYHYKSIKILKFMKAKFGSMLVDGRGKLGGHVYSKNRGGSYVRTKVSPVNPQTTAQAQARASLTARSQTWRTLTVNQRASWNSAVSNFTGTDVFGDVKTPSGLNLYNRLNLNLQKVGATLLTLPPVPTASPVIDSVSFIADESAQTVIITFAPTPVPADTTYYIEMTSQMSAGRYFAKSEFRFIQNLPATTATGAALTVAYLAKFGALVAGQKIFMRIRAVDELTGLESQPLVVSAIVVP